MNNKIVSIKKFSAIFLAIILVTGTIALSSSFMINAQAQPSYSYDGMNNINYHQKSYENDNYKSQKDSNSKNININKIKCINDNININGINSGDVNIGNKAQGYLGANSSTGGSGYSGDDGYSKQGKGFDCIINNNNTNVNTGGGNVTDGNGNETDGNGNETDACEDCFTTILPEDDLAGIIADFELVEIDSLQDICNFIDENVGTAEGRTLISSVLTSSFANAEVSFELLDQVLDCLEEVYGVDFPRLD